MQRTPATTSTADTVVDLMVAASRLTRLAATIGGDDLPRAVLRALAVLDEYGAMRITAFAHIDRCSQPAATALIGRLVAEGFATRDKDPEDQRAVVVALTPLGRERLRRARHTYGDALAARADGFAPERLAHLASDLRELLDVLERADPTVTTQR